MTPAMSPLSACFPLSAGSTLNRMFRRTLVGLGLVVAAFHVWLFASRLWAGDLADVSVSLRWAAALAVVVGLRALARSGGSLVRGRRATALWLLVALLHAPAVAERLNLETPSLPEVVATIGQVSIGAAAFALILLALVARRSRRWIALSRWRAALHTLPRPSRRPGFSLLVAPRPPPTR